MVERVRRKFLFWVGSAAAFAISCAQDSPVGPARQLAGAASRFDLLEARVKRLEEVIAAGPADMVARVDGKVAYEPGTLTILKDTTIALVQ